METSLYTWLEPFGRPSVSHPIFWERPNVFKITSIQGVVVSFAQPSTWPSPDRFAFALCFLYFNTHALHFLVSCYVSFHKHIFALLITVLTLIFFANPKPRFVTSSTKYTYNISLGQSWVNSLKYLYCSFGGIIQNMFFMWDGTKYALFVLNLTKLKHLIYICNIIFIH